MPGRLIRSRSSSPKRRRNSGERRDTSRWRTLGRSKSGSCTEIGPPLGSVMIGRSSFGMTRLGKMRRPSCAAAGPGPSIQSDRAIKNALHLVNTAVIIGLPNTQRYATGATIERCTRADAGSETATALSPTHVAFRSQRVTATVDICGRCRASGRFRLTTTRWAPGWLQLFPRLKSSVT